MTKKTSNSLLRIPSSKGFPAAYRGRKPGSYFFCGKSALIEFNTPDCKRCSEGEGLSIEENLVLDLLRSPANTTVMELIRL